MESTVSAALLNRMRVRAGLDPMDNELLLDAVQILAALDSDAAARRSQPAVMRSAEASPSSRA